LARLRPASKIGCSSCAAPVKAQLPLLNRPDSSLLAVPKLAVSEIRGKNAARAAPMLALAAISCCSAARMSGRRIRSSDGRPAGTSIVNCPSSRGSGGGRSAGSGWPTSSCRAFSSSERCRVACASAARAPSSSDSACR
jgi:hypothetical protein